MEEAWLLRNSVHVGPGSGRRRDDAVAAEDGPDARGGINSYRGQLAVDPAISPSRVLPGQPQDDPDGADGNPRSPRAQSRGPSPPDEVPVPAEQGLGLDEEPSLLPAAKEPPQPSEEDPIRLSRCWSGHLATQNGHLVPEHDDFDCQFLVVTPKELDQLEDPDERPVHERQCHGPASSQPSH
jgi:hypothetical protein